jgi:hypothetical protein
MAEKIEEQHRRMTMCHEMAAMKLDVARVEQTLQIMAEIPSFAQDRDERQWQVVADPLRKQPYTPAQLNSIRLSARQLQYRPAGRNILQTYQDYIIGKDAAITTDDEDADGKVQDYWDEWVVANSWDMKTKEIVKRLYRDGEIFLRWFLPDFSGGPLSLRFLDPGQIVASTNGKPTYGISVDPNDYENVIYYNRKWALPNGQQQSEKIDADAIDHWKIGADSDEKRGISIFQGNGKYITEYEKWLDDRIALNRIRHIWNVVGEPMSGVAAIDDMKAKFADVSYNTPTGQTPNKKMPKPGTVLFSRGVKWKLDSLNIHAQDTKEDGRSIQLMSGIGTSLPEYIARGDASNANFSSSMVSENPFVRSMESGQDLIEKIFKKVYTRVIQWGKSTGQVPAKSKKMTVTFDRNTDKDVTDTEVVETSEDCTVNFATLIHRDVEKETKAFTLQIGEGLVSKKTASEKLGYDFEAEQDQIARENQRSNEDEEKRAEIEDRHQPNEDD